MSRTYRHTNGSSKKVKYPYRQFVLPRCTIRLLDEERLWMGSRTVDIDYCNGCDIKNALSLRRGWYITAPRHYRKMLNRKEKNNFKQRLSYALKYDAFDDMVSDTQRRDAAWYF